jgi:hypothetical protein
MFNYVWIGGSCIFALVSLGVASAGIYTPVDVSSTIYQPASFELVKDSGPDDSCSNVQEANRFAYTCPYTMQSSSTGSHEFDVKGSADKDGSTQFSSSSSGSKTERYAKFKGNDVTGSDQAIVFGFVFTCALLMPFLGIVMTESLGALLMTVFGTGIACCFVLRLSVA